MLLRRRLLFELKKLKKNLKKIKKKEKRKGSRAVVLVDRVRESKINKTKNSQVRKR